MNNQDKSILINYIIIQKTVSFNEEERTGQYPKTYGNTIFKNYLYCGLGLHSNILIEIGRNEHLSKLPYNFYVIK